MYTYIQNMKFASNSLSLRVKSEMLYTADRGTTELYTRECQFEELCVFWRKGRSFRSRNIGLFHVCSLTFYFSGILVYAVFLYTDYCNVFSALKLTFEK